MQRLSKHVNDDDNDNHLCYVEPDHLNNDLAALIDPMTMIDEIKERNSTMGIINNNRSLLWLLLVPARQY